MKMNYLPSRDENYLITGTPSFCRWRANFAQNNKDFHALLSDEDLIKIYNFRTQDYIRTVMGEMRGKYKGMSPDPVEAEHRYTEAIRKGLNTSDHFAKWTIQQGASDPERHERMSLYQLEMEFAARHEPSTLQALRDLHNQIASDWDVLQSYPQREAFMRWSYERDHQANGWPKPGAYDRREELTVHEEIAEFEARNKDGFRQIIDANDRAISERRHARGLPDLPKVDYGAQPATQSQTTNPTETGLFQRAGRSLDEAIKQFDQGLKKSLMERTQEFPVHLIKDPNDPYIVSRKERATPSDVHTPSDRVMQNLGINVQPDTQKASANTSESSVKRALEDRLKDLMENAGQVFGRFAAATEGIFDAYQRERDGAKQGRRRDTERI